LCHTPDEWIRLRTIFVPQVQLYFSATIGKMRTTQRGSSSTITTISAATKFAPPSINVAALSIQVVALSILVASPFN
jgi:hypothetical protein